jgi:hypothetical protein
VLLESSGRFAGFTRRPQPCSAARSFADTDEIAAVCEVVAQKSGIYITHLRSEAE